MRSISPEKKLSELLQAAKYEIQKSSACCTTSFGSTFQVSPYGINFAVAEQKHLLRLKKCSELIGWFNLLGTASWEFLYVIFRRLYAQTGHPCTARSVWPDTALISRELTPSICKEANPTGKFWQMLNANCISAHRVELEEEKTIQPTRY